MADSFVMEINILDALKINRNKMNQISTEFTFENLIDSYNQLLTNIQLFLEKDQKKLQISSTKLGAYKKKLEKILDLEDQEIADLIGIINKYLQLNFFLQDDVSNIKFNKEDFIKAINGQHILQDTDETYNNFFFELSLGSRFIKRYKKSIQIDLSSTCDIIIDNKIAIECKYIHSQQKISENVSYAIKQINKRIEEGLAEFGVIAIDLSHVIDKNKIRKFAKKIFNNFLENYKVLADQGCFSHDLQKEGLVSALLKDKKFIAIIQSYITHEMEVIFYSSFEHKVLSKIKNNQSIKAVIFQMNESFCFENNGELFPIPMRAMQYYINQSLPDKEYDSVEKMIKDLAVGIGVH